MGKIRTMLVVGARPQFIKSAPVIKQILSQPKQIELSLVHSGQHYDPEMSEIFFRELKIPSPLANLHVGSGTHAAQTADIMKRLENPILRVNPDLILVPGDTNTTLAASLAAVKLGIPVAHIEAGLRSGDMAMPEEINRILTDHCSRLLFAPTRTAISNLRREGLREIAHLVGDTMVDALRAVLPVVRREEKHVLERLGLNPMNYMLVTLHRPSNVDNLERLKKIERSLCRVIGKLGLDAVFPVHPRTRKALAKLRSATGLSPSVRLVKPTGYIETLCLLRNAGCLLTDSGGMQKEAFLLHTPCVTLRSTTEWPETLVKRANRLVTDPEKISSEIEKVAFDEELRDDIARLKNPFGDGNASRRIAQIIKREIKVSG